MKKVITGLMLSGLLMGFSSVASAKCHVNLEIKNASSVSKNIKVLSSYWKATKRNTRLTEEPNEMLALGESWSTGGTIGIKKCDSKGRKHTAKFSYVCWNPYGHAQTFYPSITFKDGGRHINAKYVVSTCGRGTWTHS
jgi:hypothetical protein